MKHFQDILEAEFQGLNYEMNVKREMQRLNLVYADLFKSQLAK